MSLMQVAKRCCMWQASTLTQKKPHYWILRSSSMHLHCEMEEEASEETMKDVSLWNKKLNNHVKHGEAKETLQNFQLLCQSGVIPNAYTISVSLKACVALKNLQMGQQVHVISVICVTDTSAFVNSSLINMYATCGCFKDAEKVLEKTAKSDVVSCNVMINSYAKNGYESEAIELYKSMRSSGVPPSDKTFTSSLNACASLEDLEYGRQIHKDILTVGVKSNLYIDNSLIYMYNKCGSIEDAWQVFNNMQEHDAISWNAVITACAEHGSSERALLLFQQMQQEGIHPGERTYASVLSACIDVEHVVNGKQLHALVEHSNLQLNVIVASAIVGMYIKCGEMATAMSLFEKSLVSDVIAWNVTITGCTKQGCMKEAVQLYDRMVVEGISPDRVTFLSICHACGSQEDVVRSEQLHTFIVKVGVEAEVSLSNGLVDMYSKCKSLDSACYVFDKMPQRDIVSWTAIVNGYVQKELYEQSFYMYNQMLWEGAIPDKVTFLALMDGVGCMRDSKKARKFHCHMMALKMEHDLTIANTLMHMYIKCGSLDLANEIFHDIPNDNIITWNTMMSGYAKCGCTQDVFKLFLQMRVEGLIANEVTYASVLDGCACGVAFDQGKRVHVAVLSVGLQLSVFVAGALIDMYAKCGNLDHAEEASKKLVRRDVGSWSALINAYAHHGHGKKTLEVASQMLGEGITPNDVALLSVLHACSHSGLISECFSCIQTMGVGHGGIEPSGKHYACMVDLLGRIGQVEEAHNLIQRMPFNSSASSWMSLLSACRLYGNLDLAMCAFEKAHQLRPHSAAPFQLLLQMYSLSECRDAMGTCSFIHDVCTRSHVGKALIFPSFFLLSTS